MWEILSVYCIGELFEHSDQITGIRVVDSSIPTSKRILHRIEIWFKSLQYKDHIEKFFRKLLNIEPFVQVHFKEHLTAVESFAQASPAEASPVGTAKPLKPAQNHVRPFGKGGTGFTGRTARSFTNATENKVRKNVIRK